MQLNEYQEQASKTAIYPNRGSNLVYPLLGMAGEVGELYEIVLEEVLLSEDLILSEEQQILKDELVVIFYEVVQATKKAEWMKKIIRDQSDNDDLLELLLKLTASITSDTHDKLCKEQGDGLWYHAATAFELGVTLLQLCQWNLKKLFSRLQRGKLQGSGNDR